MPKTVIEHIKGSDLPQEWIQDISDSSSGTFRVTIEPEIPKDSQSSSRTQRWESLPAFGLWADYDEMKEPSQYVSNIRKPRY